jgi:peptidoglycan/xylan/chitin deacetylase (PgdA/CDA1 family)
MDWSELRHFADEQLCTLGAHTVHHYELAKLPAEQARSEIEMSLKVLEAQFGRRPRHLSYPIGGPSSAGPREYAMARELGMRSAVTTIPGGLYRQHRKTLTALPRVSLNGLFQARRYMDVFAAPAVFTMMGKV